MKRLDEKLARIRAGAYRRRDFIIADAKDPRHGAEPDRLRAGAPDGSWTRYRTRAEFLDQISAVVDQDIVDVMLTSLEPGVAASARRVRRQRRSSRRSAPTTPPTSGWCAARRYQPGALRGRSAPPRSPARAEVGIDLGLYSVTFNNDLDADVASLEAFAAFRADAADATGSATSSKCSTPTSRPASRRRRCRTTSMTASSAASPA